MASADETDSASVAPRYVDSLIWQNPDVVRFIVQTFGDSQKVDYGSFVFEGASALDAYMTTYPPPPGAYPEIWEFCSDSSIAVSYRGYEGEPDKALAKWTPQFDSGTVRILEFCGTPCWYLDLRWLDARRFLFLSALEIDEIPHDPTVNHYMLRAQVYDLARDSVYAYAAGPMERSW